MRIQQLLARDVPVIYLWYERSLNPIRADFKNFTPNPINEAWNAQEWEIEGERQGR